MRIATWNVERPTTLGRRRRLQEWLTRIDADIWILTETHEDLRPSPAHAVVATTQPDRPQRSGEAWAMIWSRYPICRLEETRDAARSVSALVALPNADELVVYATVLPWLGSAWGNPPSREGAFARALSAQLADWLHLRANHPAAAFCVAGDLNQDLAPRHYYGSAQNRAILGRSLTEAGLACLTSGALDPVFQQSNGTRAAIDHIAVSSDLSNRVTTRGRWPDSESPVRALSDHFGIWVDFA
jgi:exonuclease III